MHLISRGEDGELKLTEFVGRSTPPYAILSHTWGSDDDEVTYKDVKKGRGKDKIGFRKIDFCMRQAGEDGLQYCWVDTCCIDKTNNVELSEAINSMFKWYQNAAKCYVYLADLSTRPSSDTGAVNVHALLQGSRWWTRGWTLQELIAPRIVEFYDREEVPVGSKQDILHEIHSITQLPLEALRGLPLSRFSVEERMSWIERRQTKRDEDLAYCLLGIFGIMMPLLYGEGRDGAFARLREQIERSQMPLLQKSFTNLDLRGQTFDVPLSLGNAPMCTYFTGRSIEMLQLEQALPLDGHRRTVVLHGLGGIGKTQLAIHFALQAQDKYSAVFWINGRDKTTVRRDFAISLKRVTEVDPSSFDTEDPIQTLCKWLGLHGNDRWLLIMDNVDDPPIPNVTDGLYHPEDHLPSSPHGHVLLITRSSQSRLGQEIELRELKDEGECIDILERYSNRTSMAEEPEIAEILKRFDGLPLGLSIAGSCMRELSMTPVEYVEQYDSSWQRLQELSPIPAEYQSRTLRTTWETSLDQVRKREPSAHYLCCLLAFFGHLDIWYELITNRTISGAEWIRVITESKLTFGYYMRALRDHGLVRIASNDTSYEMHPCVHVWLREVSSKENDASGYMMIQDTSEYVLECLTDNIPSSQTRGYWVQQRRLIPHVDVWTRWQPNIRSNYANAKRLENIGLLYRDQSRLADAFTYYKHALEMWKSPGRKDPLGRHTMKATMRLGAVLMEQGRYRESEERLLSLLDSQERTLAKDDPLLLNTIKTIGTLRLKQGRLADADLMLHRAHREHESRYGADDVKTLRVMRRLGHLYEQQGKGKESVHAFEKALKGLAKHLGTDHPYVSDTQTDLGEHYRAQGDYGRAEIHLFRAVDHLRQTLGIEHRITLWAFVSAGNLRCDQGRYHDAELLLEGAVSGLVRVLGPDHARVLYTMKSRARLYDQQGDVDKAIALFEEVMDSNRRVTGQYSIESIEGALALGRMYEKQEKYADAEEIFRRTEADCRRGQLYGTPTWTESVHDLARIFSKQMRHSDTIKAYSELLRYQELRPGTNHAETLWTMEQLAHAYETQGEIEAAITLNERVLSSRETVFGPERSDTLRIVRKLGSLYKSQRDYHRAEEMKLRALQGYEKKYGFDHEPTMSTAHGLALVYMKQRKKNEAKVLLMRILEAREKTLGHNHKLTLETRADFMNVDLQAHRSNSSGWPVSPPPDHQQASDSKKKSWFPFGRKGK